jgi:hypothetical protein
MMKVVYARADKVPDDCDYITEGDEFPALNDDGEFFEIGRPDDENLVCAWKNCAHGIHWTRLDLPYRDPQAVEDLIASARKLAEAYAALCEMTGMDYHKSHFSVYARILLVLTRLEGGDV